MYTLYRETQDSFFFTDDEGVKQIFNSLEEAQAAGGVVEVISVSGVPYKIPSVDLFFIQE